MEKFGDFAGIILAVGALIATFGAISERAMGSMAQWTKHGGSIPTFIAITGPRLVALVLMVVVYIFINNDNYRLYLLIAFLFAVLAFYLFARFHRLSKIYVQKLEIPNPDGTQKVDENGKPVFLHRIIGTEDEMREATKKHYQEFAAAHPGTTIESFLRGYGTDTLNQPENAWSRETLANNSMKLALPLMYCIVFAVTTLFVLGAVLALLGFNAT